MKKLLISLLALAMLLSLCACGSKAPTEEQQLIIDAVNAEIGSEKLAEWQRLYKEFSTNDANAPKVSSVVHYTIDDFEGVAVDGYLVRISTGVGHWVNEEAQEGAMEEHYDIFIDSATKTVYDSITTNAPNGTNDYSTDENRAIYLLFMFGNYATGDYFNNTEVRTELAEADLKVINNNLK